MKIMIGVLLILLCLVQYVLWFSPGGVHATQQLKAALASQKTKNARLVKRNEALAADIHDLKHGNEAIEARARSNLGMVKRGEVFYQVVSK